jgi:hypothetical protein
VWVYPSQTKYHSDAYLPEQDAEVTDLEFNDLPPVDEERKEDERTFLADSFFGSPRHLKRQVQNALTIFVTKKHVLRLLVSEPLSLKSNARHISSTTK